MEQELINLKSKLELLVGAVCKLQEADSPAKENVAKQELFLLSSSSLHGCSTSIKAQGYNDGFKDGYMQCYEEERLQRENIINQLANISQIKSYEYGEQLIQKAISLIKQKKG